MFGSCGKIEKGLVYRVFEGVPAAAEDALERSDNGTVPAPGIGHRVRLSSKPVRGVAGLAAATLIMPDGGAARRPPADAAPPEASTRFLLAS